MRNAVRLAAVLFVAGCALGVPWLLRVGGGEADLDPAGFAEARLGRAEVLEARYQQWRAGFEANRGARGLVDLMVVTREGTRPEREVVLTGAPTLFERTYLWASHRNVPAPQVRADLIAFE